MKMNVCRGLVTVVVVLASSVGLCATRTCVADGDWTNTATWSGATVPLAGDSVVIQGHYVFAAYGSVCTGMLVFGGGSIYVGAGDLLWVQRTLVLGDDPAIGTATTGTLNMVDGALWLGGALKTPDAVSFVSGGTITYLGVSQTVGSGITYYNLTLDNGTKTADGPLTINGDLTITTGTTFQSGPTAWTHTIKGDWTNNGTLDPGSSIFIFEGVPPQSIDGATSFHEVVLKNGTKNVLGNLTFGGGLIIDTTATFNAGPYEHTVSGGGLTCDGVMNPDTGTFVFSGAGSKLLSGHPTFHHLTLSGSGGTLLDDDATVNGNLTIRAASSLKPATSVSHTLTVLGDWINRGTFEETFIDVVFLGTTDQTLTGITTFGNVAIFGGATAVLAANDTVTGDLTLGGLLVLGPHDLFLARDARVLSGGKGRCIVTNGTGNVLHPMGGLLNDSTYSFPLGPTKTTYVNLTLRIPGHGEARDTFAVRAGNITGGLPGFATIDTSRSFRWFWKVTEQTPGGNHVGFQFQCDTSEQGSALGIVFGNFSGLDVYRYNSSSGAYEPVSICFGSASLGTIYGSSTFYPITEFGTFLAGESLPLSVQMVSFAATPVEGAGVDLRWVTVSEVNNYGFYVQRRATGMAAWNDLPGSFVQGNGTSADQHTYAYRDPTATSGSWDYRLRQVDLDGTVHFSESVTASIVTSAADAGHPLQYSLGQNYPNPFNPTSTIRLTLPSRRRVTLKLYDLLGREVATLLDGEMDGGVHAVRVDATRLASGTYLYRLTSPGHDDTKKLIVVK